MNFFKSALTQIGNNFWRNIYGILRNGQIKHIWFVCCLTVFINLKPQRIGTFFSFESFGKKFESVPFKTVTN